MDGPRRAAKAEFEKYGHVWDKLGKQLDTARRTVEEAGKRTRAVSRKLRDVEALEPTDPPASRTIRLMMPPEAVSRGKNGRSGNHAQA